VTLGERDHTNDGAVYPKACILARSGGGSDVSFAFLTTVPKYITIMSIYLKLS